MQDNLKWWGYKHTSGTVHLKRYFDKVDLEEARESVFVDIVVEPFEAPDVEKASIYLNKQLNNG